MKAPEPELARFLVEHGLAGDGDASEWTPLSGGVSSDIWRVETDSGTYCVKRALAKLKVAADWEAPVERNAFEWAYLQEAARINPGGVPQPLAHDGERGLFAMAWLPPDRHPLWKTELLRGHADPAFAGSVGALVGRIHAATADDPVMARRFDTDTNFQALRIDPYLLATARHHQDLSDHLHGIAETTARTKRVLVHGDVSPKNILIGPAGPVLLDAEVAWFGDPAFDLAFCLNHLAIKARVLPSSRAAMQDSFDALARSYLRLVDWEDPEDLERRVAGLLPALALARVDGKSPLEYLDEDARIALRAAARRAMLSPADRIAAARDAIVLD